MQDAHRETIVVTGASSGIGRELALQLAGPSTEMWIVARNRERLDAVAEEIRTKGGTVHAISMDLSDIEDSERFLKENFPPGKRVDSVYLAAAISLFGEVKDTFPEDWDAVYRTNLLSPVQWTHYFYSNMVKEKSGRIVLVGSLTAYAGFPTATPYATMKTGLLGCFKSLRYEGLAYGVSLHLASPGFVDTDIYRSAIFRKTCYEKTMSEIEGMGFKVMSANMAAELIIRNVRKGKSEFAFPSYAALLKWISPRFPFVVDRIHRKMIRLFRASS